ncbi:MAG: hypothetical protein AB2A00_41305 [Myxococcota bacterium]
MRMVRLSSSMLVRILLVALLLCGASRVSAEESSSENTPSRRREVGAVLGVVAGAGAFVGVMAWGAVLGSLLGSTVTARPFITEPWATRDTRLRELSSVGGNALLGMGLAVPVGVMLALAVDGVVWALATTTPGRALTPAVALAFCLAAAVCLPVALVCAGAAAFGAVAAGWERDDLRHDEMRRQLTAMLGAAVAVWALYPFLAGAAAYLRVALLRGFFPDEESP